MLAIRRKKDAVRKIGAVIRGAHSRNTKTMAVRMRPSVSEISLRGITPAWCSEDQVQEWFSGIISPKMDYTLTHTVYKDSLWIVTVCVYRTTAHCRIMFLAHNTTATKDQEIEARLVIFGTRASALIEYTRSLALRQLSREDLDEVANKGAVQRRTGEILAGCLQLVVSIKNNAREKSAKRSKASGTAGGMATAHRRLPRVHFVVKTDINIGLVQTRYRAKLARRRSLHMTEEFGNEMKKEEGNANEEAAATRAHHSPANRAQHLERVSTAVGRGVMNEGEAATIVQAMLRGKVARSAINADLGAHRRRRESAAMMLQSSVRRRSVQLELKKQKQAASKLQARFRGHRVRKKSVVRVGEGMMSEVAGKRHHASGERARLRDSGLKGQDVDAVLRLSKLVGATLPQRRS
jgi:hypothetical protein